MTGPELAGTEAEATASRGAGRLRARLMRGLRRIGRRTLDLVLPPVCAACEVPVATPHGLCGACWSGLAQIGPPHCARLGIPFAHDIGAGALSAEAIADPPPYHRARAVAIHAGVARRLVSRFKFHDRLDLVHLIAPAMVRAGSDLLAPPCLLVPVPLHWRRLFERQYNQAALLAQAIGRARGLPVLPEGLVRLRPTAHQIGLSRADRAANVAGVFQVPVAAQGRISGARVVLVDDVLTTGATVAAATRACLRAGAASVDVLTFSRVVPGFEDPI